MIEAPRGGHKFAAMGDDSGDSDRNDGEYSVDRPGRQGNGSRSRRAGWLSRDFYTDAASGFVNYDPGSWMETIRFSMSTFVFVPWFMITGSTCLFTFYVLQLSPSLREFFAEAEYPMDAHVAMGSALSFLIVFRTNSSYGRWWEARNTWQRAISTIIDHAMHVGGALNPAAQEEVLMLHMIFTICLKAYVRDERVKHEEIGGRMRGGSIQRIISASCPPIAALHTLSRVVYDNLPMEKNTPAHTAMLNMNERVVDKLIEVVGSCERIKETPMAFGCA